jgi:hypothetical protein
MFSGLTNPFAVLLNMMLQWLVILERGRLFPLAQPGRGVVPCAASAWVACASVLDFEIWRLNG